MSKKLYIAILLAVGLVPSMSYGQMSPESKITSLPSQITQQAIKELPTRHPIELSPPKTGVPIELSPPKTGIQSYEIEKRAYHQYSVTAGPTAESGKNNLSFNNEGKASVPFAAPNTMILQFEPDVSKKEIQQFIRERKLEVINTYEKIGAIQVEGDLSTYFRPRLSDNSGNDTLIRGLVAVTEDFQNDPRIRNATPDLVLRDQTSHHSGGINITNLFTPSDVVLSDPTKSEEKIDWGIEDIQADKLWTMPGALDGVLFGVMDVGFSRHEDLVFIDLTPDTDIADHGNHVAAIACGQHDNEKGVRGVLPNCFVRARSSYVFFNNNEGGKVLDFLVLFSQVLSTLVRFVDSQDDVHTFNVSLGYNWGSSFGINPDLPGSAQWRTLVASQGAILVSLLELANKNGRVIFSAAGNDSSGLETPINAKYASPFNWAAVTAREKGIAANGVIVEAHDRNGIRAPFSNTGGHISCPGVDIFSAVAFDPQGQISSKAYGTMSGTSMASPYCASSHLLFQLVQPGYTGVEVAECMTQSTHTSSSGVPMLRLLSALGACPPKA